MNKDAILCFFHSPNSAWGLRHRAKRLPEGNTYRSLLEVLAELLEKKKITRTEAKALITAARKGKWKDVINVLEAEYSFKELEQKFLGKVLE